MRMLEGIYPATVTPFGDDGMFSPQLMAKIIRYQLDAGVDGFFLCGGTGEGLLLSREERESLLEFVLSEVSGQVGVIAHVGAYQTAETLALARHASEAGANAIAALPPGWFYRPDHLGLVQYYTAIHEASSVPLLMYNLPQRTGIEVTVELFEELMALPRIIGMKDSTGDIEGLSRFLKIGTPTIFEGEDTAVLEALKAGAAGGVGATYNMMPDRFVKLYREFKDGHLDAAQDTQTKITECLVAALPNVDTIAATKQVVNWLGLECGYGRTPNRILTEDEQTRMRTGLERVGFFD